MSNDDLTGNLTGFEAMPDTNSLRVTEISLDMKGSGVQ